MAEVTFGKWFKAQHGPRKKQTSMRAMDDEELMQRWRDGMAAEEELRARREWDVRFESALYAWQAKGKP